MNDTKKRIQKYKELLPHMKEKVAAVVLLLAMSTTMLVTVSFAWLALSKSPEVSGANTSIASNGNLEIALVGAEGQIPPVSAEGDSNLALIERNITWGNLVNLSDPAYGLDNLVLRPAQLNTAQLKTKPLYGAEYDVDGRIARLNSNFGFATWNADEEQFVITNQYGVRAISSVTRDVKSGMQTYYNLSDDAEAKNLNAGNLYVSLANDKENMQSLATMMGLYMTARMNSGDADLSNPTCDVEDIQNLAEMYAGFADAFEAEAEAMAALLNFQLFLKEGENYEPYKGSDIFTLPTDSNGDLAVSGKDYLQITDLKTFQKDYKTIIADMEKMNTIVANGGTIKWKDSGMNTIVNNLTDVGKCTMGDGTPISSIGASNAMGYLSGTQEAIITNGILYNFEERTGSHIFVKELSISATVKRSGITIPATVKANVSTSAPEDKQIFAEDLTYAQGLFTGSFEGAKEVANDTYGLVVDLWVRTNAEGSYLTLDGNVLTKTEIVRDTTTDRDGNTVELWTLTISEEVTDSETQETTTVETEVVLYKVDSEVENEDGSTTTQTTWYNASNHTIYELAEDQEPVAKMVEIETVIGYEGENRVWDGSAGLSVNSTTQGSGSCYVYYANTPEDQARSLKLLESMNVAFVDGEGKLLAIAEMDTEHFYADNGKVIVPMVLRSDSTIAGTDENGDPVYAITALEKNVATRVSAIIYLDGTDLTNSDVLSAADIQGQMNIQFGSTTDLNNADNEELRMKEIAVSASLDKSSFNYDEATESNPMTTNVTVTVEGDQPKTLTAFFIRSINSTQGSREQTMTFTYDEAAGTWKSAYTFTSPGNYILRSVQLDGIDYDLQSQQKVEIEGFTVKSLTWTADSSNTTLMTAAASTSVDLTLQFATNDEKKMPEKVQGRFIREDGTVANVVFTYNSSKATWTGTVKFVTSGNYSLEYLVLDGEYQEIDASLRKYATVYLGMKVAVYTTSKTSFKYVPDEMTAGGYDKLKMQVKIMDDTGAPMEALGGVQLTYGLRGSTVTTMNADVKWNATTGYYEGEFNALEAGAGSYGFSRVLVESNVITNATTSPTFTIISPEPPAYVQGASALESSAAFRAYLKYTSTATVMAKIKNVDTGKIYEVQGQLSATDNENNTTTWFFSVPMTNGNQDGNWQLVDVNVWNYYDADGNFISADLDDEGKLIPNVDADGNAIEGVHRDEPMVFDITAEEGKVIQMKVANMVYVTFTENQSQNFSGKNFMEAYTISDLHVDIKDFEGDPVNNLSNVRIKLVYNGDPENYGGYSTTAQIGGTEYIINLKADETQTHFVQTEDVKLTYAGTYTTTFIYAINGVDREFTGDNLQTNAPQFTVSSNAPTVTISSVSTNASTDRYYTSTTPGETEYNSMITGAYNNKIDNYNAVVYMYFAEKSNYDNEAVTIKYPTVTLGLAGVPTNHSGVTMVFGNAANSSSACTFTFEAGKTTASSSQTAGNRIGGGVNGSMQKITDLVQWIDTYPVLYPAGKQTVNQITVVIDGVTYTVNLSNAVTINNPLYPAYADFVINDSAYTGSVPGRVYSTNGETIVLPDIDNWTNYNVATALTTKNYPDPTTSDAGTYYYDRGWWRYYTYTRTKYSQSCTVESQIDNITYKLQWKIGNTLYEPGTEISISGAIEVTAVVSEASRTYVRTESVTYTKTWYTYAQTGTSKTGTEISFTPNAATKYDASNNEYDESEVVS